MSSIKIVLVQKMTSREQGKKRAAKVSIEMIEETDKVIGVGSGTTIAYSVHSLKERIEQEGLKIKAIPTSYQARFLLMEYGIPITTLNEHPVIDVAIDGADEVDPNLDLIKGGGAALTLEKIIDNAAKRLIIIVDESKLVTHLGERFALPIEVVPQAYERVLKRIKKHHTTEVQVRMAIKKLGPVVTDLGNFILDARFDKIKNPEQLERDLNIIPGVVENGLFLNMADVVLVGKESSVERREKKKKTGQVKIMDS